MVYYEESKENNYSSAVLIHESNYSFLWVFLKVISIWNINLAPVSMASELYCPASTRELAQLKPRNTAVKFMKESIWGMSFLPVSPSSKASSHTQVHCPSGSHKEALKLISTARSNCLYVCTSPLGNCESHSTLDYCVAVSSASSASPEYLR